MKVPNRRTNTVTDYSSTDPKGIGQLPQQEQFPYLLAQLLEWSRSTQLHTVDVTLRMEPDGSTNLSLTARRNHSSKME